MNDLIRSFWKDLEQRTTRTATLGDVIEEYLFNESTRQSSLESIQSASIDPLMGDKLVDLLRRQLEPHYGDPDRFHRERYTIQLCASIDGLRFPNLCSRDRKFMNILEYHLRACAYLDLSAPKQLRLARGVQQWLDSLVATFDDEKGELEPLFALQKKYLSAWREIDERMEMPVRAVGRRNRRDGGRVGDGIGTGAVRIETPRLQRALPSFRPRSVYMTIMQVEEAISDANILCFDILKMVMDHFDNRDLLTVASAQAESLKVKFSQFSNLQIRLQESEYELRLKGQIIDAIMRLDFCTQKVAEIQSRDGMDEIAREPEGSHLLPPRYKFRL